MPSRQQRRRIGLLLPSSNTTQEAEFTRILPAGVTLHVARLPLRTVEPSSTARVVEDIESESQKLSDADVDVIVLAATAPSSRNGIGYDQELIGRIERASGRKATTAPTALIQALIALDVERPQAATGKPVLTSNQVNLWAVPRLADCHAEVAGWGRLLRDHLQ